MAKKLTQKELAEKLGVHSDTIYMLENNKNKLNVRYIIKLENILECELCKYDPYLNFSKHTAKNILALRQSKGMTKKEFAKEFNISVSTINSWESGRNLITRKLFHRIFL